MKKLILIIAAAVLLSALSNMPIKAAAGNYYTYNKVLCARYLNMSHQALKMKDYARAKLFAMKAIQSDTFNKTAWADYDLIVAKMAGGKIKSHHYGITVKSKSMPKKAPAASSGGAFVGC